MSHIHTIRLLLEGRVQGVGFRPFVCRAALSLGLTGWVKNLGGVVEIRASGDREALLALERKLEEAPYPVAVEKVTKEEVPLENFSTFSAIESSGEPLAPLFRRISPSALPAERSFMTGRTAISSILSFPAPPAGPGIPSSGAFPMTGPARRWTHFPCARSARGSMRI